MLDLGKVPLAKHFPFATDPVSAEEASHPLGMGLCRAHGLAQLVDDDIAADEPPGLEPQALKDQAEAAIDIAAEAGWLRGRTVREFGSPQATWIPLLALRGFTLTTSSADTVLDSFGIMHEPNQRDAFVRRALATDRDCVLLLQYHSIATIVEKHAWNSLRHGHFAYFSTTALMRLLGVAGMRAVTAWEFALYGGTVLLAAVHEDADPDESVLRILKTEESLGVTDPNVLRGLQHSADDHVQSLRNWLKDEAAPDRTVWAYGAASPAVALFSRARLDIRLVGAVADASPAKQGRRMPATNIPIVAPEELVARSPDRVLLTLPDLLPEVSARFSELNGRWKDDGE